MPRETISVEVAAPCDAVFALIHDYGRRLTWDSMLSEACLLDGAAAAGVGVRSLCVGNWRSLFLPMETRYVSFTPGRLAAVCLTNHPPFFAHFAATIRHDALDSLSADHSRVTYIYFFQAKPRFAAALLEPIMNSRLKREVRGRLHALRSFFEGARL